MTPLVSVIVPVYNKERYIAECLKSISDQTYRNIEILCVDNNSRDGSSEIIKSYMHEDGRVRLLHESEQGLSSARNCGIENANGKYIVFVDADDCINRHLLTLAVDSAERNHSDIVLYSYGSDSETPGIYKRVKARDLPSCVVSPQDLGENLPDYVMPSAWTKMFRREFLNEKGIRFDPQVKQAEDVLFSYCVIAVAEKVSSIPWDVMYFYKNRTDGSMVADRAENSLSIKVLDVYSLVEDWLSGRGLMEQFEGAFLRRLLLEIDFTLSLSQSLEEFESYYNEFNSRYRKRFEENASASMKDSYLYRVYILSSTASEAAFKKTTEKKDDVGSTSENGRLASLKKRARIHGQKLGMYARAYVDNLMRKFVP